MTTKRFDLANILTQFILISGDFTLNRTSERWNDLQDLGGTAVHLSSAASNFVYDRGVYAVYAVGKIPAMNVTRSIEP